jgi:hypothetical protein
MGRLVRQDVYTAEEIKMIFGFLWAKKPNKVWQGDKQLMGTVAVPRR